VAFNSGCQGSAILKHLVYLEAGGLGEVWGRFGAGFKFNIN
jgi:hypothetical protein